MNHLRILLVEDESSMADTYTRMLGRLVEAFPGAVITRVESLVGVREILQKLTPDVAVLDLNLKDALAPETVIEIETISKKCAVVVVTGLDAPGLREQAMQYGAHSFIHKLDLAERPSLLERTVVAAITAFKINKREGLSRDIEALRKFALSHGPET